MFLPIHLENSDQCKYKGVLNDKIAHIHETMYIYFCNKREELPYDLKNRILNYWDSK